jgi:putative RNA 2'-phosphotransferase
MDKQLVNSSKRVSWLLRHGAPEQGIPMDSAGWVAVADVLRALRMSEAQLDAVVAQNDKLRFERQGPRIRAVQGHSAASVSLEGLEASWRPFEGVSPIFHGTSVEAALAIAKEGITAQARSHVHLAPSRQSKVGKRWNVDLLLAVEPSRVRAHGIGLFESPNGVVLARRIPADCITGVDPLTRRAQAQLAGLRSAFGVDP